MNKILLTYFRDDEYANAEEVVEELLKVTRNEIIEIIEIIPDKPISPAEIPQYSSYEDATFNMIHYLRCSGNFGPNFEEVGQHYLDVNHNSVAFTKYGENHSKTAALLGLVDIDRSGRYRAFLNKIGIAVEKRSIEEQVDCISKLAARVPIVRYAIKHNINSAFALEEELKKYLSVSTAKRRKKNTWDLISFLRGDEKIEFKRFK